MPQQPHVPETELCALARLHQTDKGGAHHMYGGAPTGFCHAYTPLYHRIFTTLFGPDRAFVGRMLEVGVHRGCSLWMWRNYFPNAKIVGADIGPPSFPPAERIRVVQADSTTSSAPLLLGPLPYDVIVDDGSHACADQQATLRQLLPLLAPIGVYVIEDLEACTDASAFHLLAAAEGYAVEEWPSPQGCFCGCGCGVPSPFTEALIVIALPSVLAKLSHRQGVPCPPRQGVPCPP